MPLQVTLIGQVPGVVADPTFHVHDTTPEESAVLGPSPLAELGIVDHGHGKYVSGDTYTNTAESWIALLKHGIMGSFHHVSEEHLDRYANEFAFRWDYRNVSDGERMVKAVEGIEGKRLVYKETVNQKASD